MHIWRHINKIEIELKPVFYVKTMKFPSVEVNTNNTINLAFMFNRIFGEENAIEYIDNLDNGNVCIHFNQELPMTPEIEKFYALMKETGEIKFK
jgi:hypothetical protein